MSFYYTYILQVIKSHLNELMLPTGYKYLQNLRQQLQNANAKSYESNLGTHVHTKACDKPNILMTCKISWSLLFNFQYYQYVAIFYNQRFLQVMALRSSTATNIQRTLDLIDTTTYDPDLSSYFPWEIRILSDMTWPKQIETYFA